MFGQGIAEPVPGRLRFGLGGRHTHVHYHSPESPQFGVVESSRDFVPTGETLRQIQDRVLPLGATINGVTVLNDRTGVPLYIQTDGWIALDVQGGMPLTERLNLDFGFINLLDRNYRSHGSGMDAPGINVYVGICYTF